MGEQRRERSHHKALKHRMDLGFEVFGEEASIKEGLAHLAEGGVEGAELEAEIVLDAGVVEEGLDAEVSAQEGEREAFVKEGDEVHQKVGEAAGREADVGKMGFELGDGFVQPDRLVATEVSSRSLGGFECAQMCVGDVADVDDAP